MLKPLTNEEWPAEIADMRDGFAGRLNVYRTMAHHPALLRAWADLRDHVVVRTVLTRQQSEVVILRAGHGLGSHYEWAQHVVRARACGMHDARIEAVRGPLEAIAEPDRSFARAVDELLADAQLSTDTLAAFTQEVGTPGVLDLMATVGFYSTLAYLLKTFEVPVDAEIPSAP